MSTIEIDETISPNGHVVDNVTESPQHYEGFLLPEDWHFDAEVVRMINRVDKQAEVPDEWGNVLTRWTVQMSDGVKLGVNYCEPKERRTDIAILETPAWLTNLHGFNENTQRTFGSKGIPSILIGHVGQERESALRETAGFLLKPWKTVREMRGISLARQAHNMMQIYKFASEQFQLNPNFVFLHGNSRGGMVQFPLLAMAHEQGIEVPFAMPVAPCFAEGFSKATAQELRRTPGAEIWNVGKLVARNMFDMAGSGVNTINLSPKSIAYEAAHTNSLFNGDAGRFDNEINPEQNMLVLAYESDIAGMLAKWKQKFDSFPNVYVRGVPGAHSSIADKRTKDYVMNIFGNYAEQLHDGQNPVSLDHSHVRRPMTIVN